MPDRIFCPACGAVNKVNGDSWPICNGCKRRLEVIGPKVDGPDWTLPEPPIPDVPELPGVPSMPPAGDSGLDLVGRGFHQPYFTVHVRHDRIVLRVDDNLNTEAWVQLTITAEMVGRWFRDLAEYVDDQPSGDDQEQQYELDFGDDQEPTRPGAE